MDSWHFGTDPDHWLTDPEQDPDALHVSDVQDANKNIFYNFYAYYSLKLNLIYSLKIKIMQKSRNSRNQRFFILLLLDGRIRIRSRIRVNNDGSGSGRCKTCGSRSTKLPPPSSRGLPTPPLLSVPFCSPSHGGQLCIWSSAHPFEIHFKPFLIVNTNNKYHSVPPSLITSHNARHPKGARKFSYETYPRLVDPRSSSLLNVDSCMRVPFV